MSEMVFIDDVNPSFPNSKETGWASYYLASPTLAWRVGGLDFGEQMYEVFDFYRKILQFEVWIIFSS